MPFGSPVSGTLSTAESPMAQQQQHKGSWTLLEACRVGAAPQLVQACCVLAWDSIRVLFSAAVEAVSILLGLHLAQACGPLWRLSRHGVRTTCSSVALLCRTPRITVTLQWCAVVCLQGSAPTRAASMDAGQAWLPNQHYPQGSRLQHSSSSTAGDGAVGASHAATGTLHRAATISEGAAEVPLQRRASSPSAVAAPGLDLAMYRASGRLLPLNLNYLPKSLTK